MARLPRYNLPGQPQHIIVRGNNRNNIFTDEFDYKNFKEYLIKASKDNGCAIHAYILMPNHVHLLITPKQETSVSKAMQSLGRRYVQYFNQRNNRTGTLWEGRYKATLVDSKGYLLTCMRYIELNPVRAGLASSPWEYPWSSYLCNAEGQQDDLVTEHEQYDRLGHNKKYQQQAYKKLFELHLDDAELAIIRDATNKGWALGDINYKQQIELLSSRRSMPLAKGRRKNVTIGSRFEDILSLIK